MVNFTTQTQGLDTFQVCEVVEGMHIDTVGIGMLLNNRIDGLCQISDVHIDNKEIIRYNISSQIPLKIFLMEKIDKRRFLTIFGNILHTIECIEEYLLEPGMLLLDPEYIYINVSTLQTSLIYYPIVEEAKSFNVKDFAKAIIMNMEFDPNERDNYVGLLINFINSQQNLTVSEMKEFIENLSNNQAPQIQQPNQQYQAPNFMNNVNYGQEMNNSFYNSNPVNQSPMGANMPNQNYSNANFANQNNNGMNQGYNNVPGSGMPTPNMPNPNTVTPGMSAPNMAAPNMPKPGMPAQPNANMGMPQGQVPPMPMPAPQTKEKKKGLSFSLFSKKPKEENGKKEDKKAKNKKGAPAPIPTGMVIPGMENDTPMGKPMTPPIPGAPIQQTTPTPPKPAMPQPGNNPQPAMGSQAGFNPQPAMAPQAGFNPQPAMAPQAGFNPQPAMAPQAGFNPQPTMAPQAGFNSQQMPNYGGTVVLGVGDIAAGTTILTEGYNTMERNTPPYLIRKKTNERIDITKDIFKIGKERSYVDYWVSDNSAVSRSHANIIKQNNEFYIMDNNSLNHTFLDGKQIPSQQMIKLEDFMVIKMADELFEFRL